MEARPERPARIPPGLFMSCAACVQQAVPLSSPGEAFIPRPAPYLQGTRRGHRERGCGGRDMGRARRGRGHGGDGSPWPPGGVLFACGLLLGGPAFAQEERCEDAPPLPADAPVQAGPPADAPLNEETVREDASRKRFHPWLAVGEITAINQIGRAHV